MYLRSVLRNKFLLATPENENERIYIRSFFFLLLYFHGPFTLFVFARYSHSVLLIMELRLMGEKNMLDRSAGGPTGKAVEADIAVEACTHLENDILNFSGMGVNALGEFERLREEYKKFDCSGPELGFPKIEDLIPKK